MTPLPESWTAFEVQCRARLADIEKHKDEGLYAQAYARDVGKLLRMISRINEDEFYGDVTPGANIVGEAYENTP